MFIDTKQFSILEAACGIQLSFSTVSPIKKKIANIIGASRNVGISNIQISNISDEALLDIRNNNLVGQKITVSQAENLSIINASGIPQSFLGNFVVKSATSTNITFEQNLPFTTPLPAPIFAELYKQENIPPADQYLIRFVVETKVPGNADIIIRPSYYIVSGYDEFTPTSILEAKSRFSKSIKVLVKMIIEDANKGTILKTEYKEIIVSDSSSKPCEIIYDQPIEKSYVDLNHKNHWQYYHQGYLLAEFLPTPEYKNIILKLTKKDTRLLPTRTTDNRLRIIADPIRLQTKKTSIDKIRSAILNQYDTINNSLAIANLGNKSYDIIVEDKLLKPEDLANVVVDIVPPETGVPVKFSDVAKAVYYDQDLDTIPKVSILKWNNSFIGELHYNSKIYDQDNILVDVSGNGTVVLSGIVKDVTNGINSVSQIAVVNN